MGAWGADALVGYWENGDAGEARARLDFHCKEMSEAGIRVLNFRVTTCGRALWKSNYVLPATLETSPHNEGICRLMNNGYDPFAEAVKAAHRNNMHCLAWFDLFDWYRLRQFGSWPFPHNLNDPWFESHPEFYVCSKEGKSLRGVPCYAYKEVVDRILAMIDEIIGYGADGVYFSTRTHSGPTAERPLKDDQYGYNDKMIEDFKKKYAELLSTEFSDGKKTKAISDPLSDTFDYDYFWDKWQDLKGDYITDFLRRAAEKIHAKGQKVFIDVHPVDTIMLALIHNSGGNLAFELGNEAQPPLIRTRMHWQKWMREKIIDGLSVMTSPYNPLKTSDDIRFIDKFYSAAKYYGCSLLLFVWLRGNVDFIKGARKIEKEADVNGVVWHGHGFVFHYKGLSSDEWKPINELVENRYPLWASFR